MRIKSLFKKVATIAAKVAVIASLAVGTLAGTNLSTVHADSVSGQAIVDMAAQYIGKVPYVWGGNNIEGNNVGADCSGFICRIYEKFGFNFWPNRTALRKYGENLGTDISVAKLGDIIWYDGHVAIYAGLNDKGEPTIIHETGGSYKNVVWTKHKVVNATLKGVIRIPGIDGDGSGTSSNNSSVSISNLSVDSITETNAVVRATCYKTSGTWIDECGLYLGTDSNNMPRVAAESVGSGANKKNGGCDFDIWYDLNKETSVRLEAGTTYYYQFYCVSGGQTYYSSVNSFVSGGSKPVYEEPQNTYEEQKTTYSAKVSIGNYTWLLIRKSASVLGKGVVYVRNGATVTVHSDKTKGSWSYIEIGKYKGYVKSKYLK